MNRNAIIALLAEGAKSSKSERGKPEIVMVQVISHKSDRNDLWVTFSMGFSSFSHCSISLNSLFG